MRIRTIIGTGVVAAAGAAAAVVIPLTAHAQAAPAAPAAQVHTVKFTSVTQKQVEFSPTAAGLREVDVNTQGKTVGYDVVYATFNPKANTGTISAAVVLSGGIILVHAPSAGSAVHGSIVGGTNQYARARGTFTGKQISQDKESVTITYTLGRH